MMAPPSPPPPERSVVVKIETRPIVVGVIVLVLIGVIAAIWYFGFYDTAQGRCSRGDVGACVVYYATQSPSPAPPAATDAGSPAGTGECVVGPGDSSHNVRIEVSNPASTNVQTSDCQSLLQNGWTGGEVVGGSQQVCQFNAQDGTAITVWDTGGQYYGHYACDHYVTQGDLPPWPMPGS